MTNTRTQPRSIARPHRLHRTFVALLAAAMMSLSACSSGLLTSQLSQLEVVVSPGANQDNAVAVDVLFIYDTAMLDRVLMLSAQQWFTQRDQFTRDFPTGYDIVQWELAPGQTAPTRDVPDGAGNAIAGIVFADYVTPGDHRARIDTVDAAQIQLNKDDFIIKVLP